MGSTVPLVPAGSGRFVCPVAPPRLSMQTQRVTGEETHPRAKTVHEAAEGPALEFQNPDPGSYYVHRPRLEVNGRTPPPFAEQVRNRLIGRMAGPCTLLVTGQLGSGKSSELRRVLREQSVRTRFERVAVPFRKRVDLIHGEIRATLLAVATSVAEHLGSAHPEGPPGKRFDPVRRWFRKLEKDYEDIGITPSDFGEASLTFGGVFAKLTAKVRDEERLRTRVLADPRFDVSELLAVANALVSALSEAAERNVLIWIDDTDKLTEEAPAYDIFIDNFDALSQRLDGAKLITFPYWLNFSDRFGETSRQAHKVYSLDNVKIIRGPGDDELLPEAERFFEQLAHARLASDIIESDAIRLAARFSAGIPREFIRILRLAAEDAVDYQERVITRRLVEGTLTQLRRETSRMTHSSATAEALKRIRRDHRLKEKDDRYLLRSLLVVEMPNENPWYDVHPILGPYVDALE